MALSKEDFKEPKGDFIEAEFPEEDLDALLEGWLDNVSGEKEEVQRAYVNWRGNRHIARRMNREAATFRLEDQGQRQRLAKQMQYFQEEAQNWEAEYERLTAPEEEGEGWPIVQSRR